MANAADLKARIGAKAGLVPKPKISGPVLENYNPTWGDRIAQYMGSLMGNSNAGTLDATKFWREKINPITPIVGAQEAYKTGKAKAASGDLQGGIMDVAGQFSGPEASLFIGPMAKSWEASAAKEAQRLLKKGWSMDDIWQKTRTSFLKKNEKEGPGSWSPYQAVSTRNTVIDPDIKANIPGTRAEAKPIEEFMESPLFSEYKGSGKVPFWEDTRGGGVVGGLWSNPWAPPKSLKGISGISFAPGEVKAPLLSGATKPTGLISANEEAQNMFAEQIMAHEGQHMVRQLEGWPAAQWGMLEPNKGMLQPGSPEYRLYDELVGSYGKSKYPWISSKKGRAEYGMYQHDADETMSRNAEAGTFLSESDLDVYPPHRTQDIPFDKQYLANEAKERQDRILMNALVGLKP